MFVQSLDSLKANRFWVKQFFHSLSKIGIFWCMSDIVTMHSVNFAEQILKEFWWYIILKFVLKFNQFWFVKFSQFKKIYFFVKRR